MVPKSGVSLQFLFYEIPNWHGVSFAAITAALILSSSAALAATGPMEADEDGAFIVMTFNSGTGATPADAGEDNLGYGREQARISDAYYGNGLAWKPAIDAVHDFVQEISPDIVAFQEMFCCDDCETIPEEARTGFVCEDWTPGSPSIARLVLGEDYQIATHPGNNDKYLAVHKRFGRMRGSESDTCPGGLEGARVEGCGGGARIARTVIERYSGPPITVLSYHGTSGFCGHDRECRALQVDRIFVDFGDGTAGVNGNAHVILGDFNTDPRRLHCVDRSARRWNDFTGDKKQFHFVTDQGSCAPGAYLGPFHIDHIVSDVFDGKILYHGKTGRKEQPFPFQMFDHTPVVARMTPRITTK